MRRKTAHLCWMLGFFLGGGCLCQDALPRAIYAPCPKCLCCVCLAGLRPVVQPEEDAQQTQAHPQSQPAHGRVPAVPQEVHPQRLPQSPHGERARGNGGLEAAGRLIFAALHVYVTPVAFSDRSITCTVQLWPVSTDKDVEMHFFFFFSFYLRIIVALLSHLCPRHASPYRNCNKAHL